MLTVFKTSSPLDCSLSYREPVGATLSPHYSPWGNTSSLKGRTGPTEVPSQYMAEPDSNPAQFDLGLGSPAPCSTLSLTLSPVELGSARWGTGGLEMWGLWTSARSQPLLHVSAPFPLCSQTNTPLSSPRTQLGEAG